VAFGAWREPWRARSGASATMIRQRRIHERYSVDAMVDAYERIYLRDR